MKHVFQFLVLAIALVLFSCSKEVSECVEAPLEAEQVQMSVEQLHNALPSINSKTDLVQFLSAYPVIRDKVLHREEYPDDSTFINALYNRFTNPHIDSLLMETNRVFGDMTSLKK